MSRQKSNSLVSLDLLPISYRRRARARQVIRSWFTVVAILVAVFFVVLAKSIRSAYLRTERNAKIGWAALPIRQLREDVIVLQSRNRQRSQWCNLVHSAKPDDSALQALAGIAGTLRQADRAIFIDTLQLRLPVETGPLAKLPPLLSMDLRSKDLSSRRSWLDRLEHLDRIESFDVEQRHAVTVDSSVLGLSGLQHVQVTGIPIATRVLP
jgi:hypothetical protein